MHDERISVTDWNLLQTDGASIVIGKAFAFVGKEVFSQPSLAWVSHIFGLATIERPHVVSLLGPRTVQLPGVNIRPQTLPNFILRSITSDKAIYRCGQDVVNVFVVNPLGPNSNQTLVITANGSEFGRHPVRLGPQGEAAFPLRDLPVGDYEIRFEEADDDEPACEFTVAEYRLAPLVAALVDRSMEPAKQKLAVKIRLESYGTPVNGDIQLELTETGRRLATVTAIASQGLVEAQFTLSGSGPFAINVRVAADAAKTATVPIVGSRAAERSLTLFSSLGTEVHGSLLPSPGAKAVRGIFLEEGATTTTPFHLERVGARKARVTTTALAQSVRLVAIDPTFPRARAGAVNPTTAQYPGNTDERYQRGEAMFKAAYFSDACSIFERARDSFEQPHPFYAYFAACCYARQGMPGPAVAALRTAIEDGWNDFQHLATDEDLASLRGYPAYELLKNGGRREVTFDQLAPGQTVEIDMPEPVSILAIGAYVNQKPWEGWAATLSPERSSLTISTPHDSQPGREVTIEFEKTFASIPLGGQHSGALYGGESSLYVIVKDARLMSPDSPTNRLAGRMKAYVESAAKQFSLGAVTRLLKDAAPPEYPSAPTYYKTSMPFPPPVMRASIPMAMPASAPGAARPAWTETVTGALAAPIFGAAEGTAGMAADLAAGPPGPEPAKPNTTHEPEVLFAGLVKLTEGSAQLKVKLAEEVADYVVEAFLIGGLDWTAAETRFRAEKDPFLSLSLPLFVHSSDGAVGRVFLSSKTAQSHLKVTCDGRDIPLAIDNRALAPGEPITAATAEISFLASPGEYRAEMVNLTTGLTEVMTKRVEVPGRFRRLARTLRFLEPGQSVSRREDPKIVGLQVLPGLDAPFTALMEATSEYGHACCEQTAAILLAACGMYAFAEQDPGRREKAESIILAGVKREESMWLRGRGFKMYPEYANEPHSYYGPKAARYLWNLDLLKTTNGNGNSKALAKSLAAGLEMAADTSQAYGIPWPVKEVHSCEDAYQAVRFNRDKNVHERAVAYVRTAAGNFPQNPLPLPSNPYLYGAVLARSEMAYGAAALFRAGGPQDRKLALALANAVVKDINETGRLYSTFDSVPAIALMSELKAANIVGGKGMLSVNGQPMASAEAATFAGEIETLEAIDGVSVVEVMRLVEEDWNSFSSGLQLRISLEKEGRVSRSFTVGDAVDLKVKIEEGYKVGDLLWVCLPDALSRVIGGGQVKLFSVDFAGQSELSIPLAATSITLDKAGHPGPQHFAVCVRNMFEEERGGSAGFLNVTVSTASDSHDSSIFSRISQAFRKMLE